MNAVVRDLPKTKIHLRQPRVHVIPVYNDDYECGKKMVSLPQINTLRAEDSIVATLKVALGHMGDILDRIKYLVVLQGSMKPRVFSKEEVDIILDEMLEEQAKRGTGK